jgi:hypothetical protein
MKEEVNEGEWDFLWHQPSFRVQVKFPFAFYVFHEYTPEPGEWKYSFNWRKVWLLLTLVFYPLVTFAILMGCIAYLCYIGAGDTGGVLGIGVGVLTALVGIMRHELYTEESWRNRKWITGKELESIEIKEERE